MTAKSKTSKTMNEMRAARPKRSKQITPPQLAPKDRAKKMPRDDRHETKCA